jgi:hypothetical protein
MESETRRGHGGLFWTLVIGIALGVAGTILLPQYARQYLPDLFGRPVTVEGKVLEKESEIDRLLLKIVTEEGVVLATFTERQREIGLLVDVGDTVVMDLEEYDPFLTDPALRRVKKPHGEEGPLHETPTTGTLAPPEADDPEATRHEEAPPKAPPHRTSSLLPGVE